MNTLWMTWTTRGPRAWPIEKLRESIKNFRNNQDFTELWRIAAYKKARVGDRVFLFRQGPKLRGIFGVGQITGECECHPELSQRSDGRSFYAPLNFTELRDPISEPMILSFEDLRAACGDDAALKRIVNAQSSGVTVPTPLATAIAKRLGMTP